MATKSAVKKTTGEGSVRRPRKKVAAPPTREAISRLAEQFWIERGKTDGYAEQDWLRAEQNLMAQAS